MDFTNLELSQLREKLDNKEVSSVELTRFFLDRIKTDSYNSFLTIPEELALKQAQIADEFIAGPGENPLLCGIPYAAKDLFCTKGVRTTAASKILENYIPEYNATVINKLEEEKSVLVGKTNLDQFAHGSSTETSYYGPSKNPWDTTRIPGGSSGGSSAAVAARLVPWAMATETGGSIRLPASLCGVTGWKPTYGRVSRYGCIAMASSLDSMGAIGISVRDLAMVAQVLSGRDVKDSTTGLDENINFFDNLKAEVDGMTIGVPDEYFPEGLENGVRTKVLDAISVLEKLGAKIKKVSVPHTRFGSLVYAIVAPSEISSNLARYDGIRYGHRSAEAKDLYEVYAKTRDEGFGIEAKRRILTGTYVLSHGYYDAYYKKAQKVRRLIMNEFDEVFKEVDLLAAPSSPNVAVPIGNALSNPLFGYIADQLNIPSSLGGLPALSLPAGFARSEDGGDSATELPVGLQLIGPQWSEQKLFNAGAAFQAETDFHKQRP